MLEPARMYVSGLAIALALLSLSACTSQDGVSGLRSTWDAREDDIPQDKVAICVWPQVGLRVEPSRKRYTRDNKSNFIATIFYGEKVEVLPDSTVREDNNNTWMRVRLRDSTIGWVNEYLFERNARLAVVLGEAQLYLRPDLMTLRDDKLETGEIVVVSAEQPNWIQITGREKRKKGWIQKVDNLSLNNRDVWAALLYYKAGQERSPAAKVEKLQAALADEVAASSRLKPLIESKLAELREVKPDQATSEQENRLQIIASRVAIHKEPKPDSSNVVTELVQGDYCTIVSKGEPASIDTHKDYWYKVRFEDQEGWVFGYYTSLRSGTATP
ncbi:MAG: SH3 domain-containing protein [Bacteroidia bacterium]|nr:SH3 domain-containing protein [Bacteroidia bacterium]